MALRAGWRIAGLLFWMAVCLVGYTVARRFGPGTGWVRRFFRHAARSLGADLRILGTPCRRDTLFVANHLSWFDILALGSATGTAFVSKQAVADWPGIGTLARIGGTIFIDHGRRAAVRQQTEALSSALTAGRLAAFFPEGTTGDGHGLLPFRAALFAALPARGVLVQPVAIDYRPHAAEVAWKQRESALDVALRLIGRPGRLPITLRFLPPIDPAGLDRKQIAARAHQAIADALA